MTTPSTTRAAPARSAPHEIVNVAAYLPRLARKSPDLVAVWTSAGARFTRARRWRSLTWRELDARSDAIAHGFVDLGLARGDRTALFVRPGADLVAITFALFKIGAVPVLMDPGMGHAALVAGLARIAPRAFIGVPAAHALRALHAHRLASIEIRVSVGAGWFPGTARLASLTDASRGAFAPAEMAAEDAAAILFTSGSTGPPKGVVYTHGVFEAQIGALRAMYGLAPGEIDLACFPLFALFNTALEITSVFPPLDFARPASGDPAAIVDAIRKRGCTTTFGSPAIWKRAVPWCLAHGTRLPSLKRVLIAGASVPPALIEDFRALLPSGADVHTPYGATECLPVSTISGREIEGPIRARTESGAGTCIGRAAPGITVELIRITDDPIAQWSDDLRVAPGELGEICARGAVVTREYAHEPEHTAAAKIEDGEAVLHRMGDVGYVDAAGLLWFCGRKSERIETAQGLVMPVPSENIYDLQSRVARTALVGLGARGSQRPVLIVEPVEGAFPRGRRDEREFATELREHFEGRATAGGPNRLVEVDDVRFHADLPVDARHNAKIKRGELRDWAQRER